MSYTRKPLNSGSKITVLDATASSKTLTLLNGVQVPLSQFTGYSSWNVIGKSISASCSIQAALKRLLGWDIEVLPVSVQSGTETVYRKIGNRYVSVEIPVYKIDKSYIQILRSDTKELLSIQLGTYVPVNNEASFTWLQPLVDEKMLQLSSIIELNQGREIYCLFRTNQQLRLNNDTVHLGFVVGTSHDTTLGLNIASYIYREPGHIILLTSHHRQLFKHTENINVNIGEIRSWIKSVCVDFSDNLGSSLLRLIDLPINEDGLQVFCRQAFNLPVNRAIESFDPWLTIRSLFRESAVLNNVPNSLYRGLLATGIHYSHLSGGTRIVENYASRFRALMQPGLKNSKGLSHAYTVAVQHLKS